MALYVLALLIGIIAGFRTMTAPAAVIWAAHLGWLPLENTPLAFLGFAVTPYIITVLAIGELISDQLPKTPDDAGGARAINHRRWRAQADAADRLRPCRSPPHPRPY
jgi:uncharacterized membrane protein